jgi:hypothetical protein
MKIFHAQKNDIDLYKIFFENKSSLSQHIMKEKNEKKNIPTPFLQLPRSTPPKQTISWKTKKNSTLLP